MRFIPFTAVTRMSGVDFDGNEIRKGAADAMQAYVTHAGGMYSEECDNVVKSIASKGGTPLVVAKNHQILGVIHLKDIIKQGVKEKFADLRKMGIKTIMITAIIRLPQRPLPQRPVWMIFWRKQHRKANSL